MTLHLALKHVTFVILTLTCPVTLTSEVHAT